MNAQFYFTYKGLRFLARPIQPSDKDLLQSGFRQLSDKAKFLRFSSIDNKLSNFQLNYLTEVDGINHVAWGVLDVSGETPIPVGIARFIRIKDNPDAAEIGITVTDSYQKRGIGKLLFILMNIIAGHRDVKRLRYHVLSENRSVLKYLKHFEVLNQVFEGPLTLLETKVIRSHLEIPAVPEMQDFRASMKEIEEAMGM